VCPRGTAVQKRWFNPGVPPDLLAELERWQAHGAAYRIAHVSESLAVVELLTCHGGEPVDRLESRDPQVIERLRAEAAAEER
jgi:hypothetical protein